MKIAYIDCFSGIAGDMFLAALIDAGASLGLVRDGLRSMGLGNVGLEIQAVNKNGFRASYLRLQFPTEHAHRGFSEIASMIERSAIDPKAKSMATAIFYRIALAEAHVHGMSIESVHFHEVGAIDSICDIVGSSIAWTELGIESAISAPVPTGTGSVTIAHGTVSLPAPATAEILKGIPLANCSVPFELTTPTGAAIVAELARSYGPIPAMVTESIGYGAGTRNLSDRPNLLRLLVGQVDEPSRSSTDTIVLMETNLDDISAEQIAYASEQLLQKGALDVFTTSVMMKKGRPGCLLTVLCHPRDHARLENLLFAETGTLGIRYRVQSRSIAERLLVEVPTPWGIVRGKVSRNAGTMWRFSPEFDDCRQIAIDYDLRLSDVIKKVEASFDERRIELDRQVELKTPPVPSVPLPDHSHHDHSHHDHSHHDHSHHDHSHHDHSHHDHSHHDHSHHDHSHHDHSHHDHSHHDHSHHDHGHENDRFEYDSNSKGGGLS